MGIDWNTARFLMACAAERLCFQRVLMLGRQEMHVSAPEIASIARRIGTSSARFFEAARCDPNGYAEEFLRLLGAQDIFTLDASSYEGADIIHDLNIPLTSGSMKARQLAGTFDIVLNGGTLEHVFNFPIAMKSAMELVKTGGHLIIQAPANNYCGHGFYQFSPELFCKILSPQNGFVMERMLVYEVFPRSPMYDVADAARVARRVQLIGKRHQVLLLVLARKVHDIPIFETPPQQSDYERAWESRPAEQGTEREAADIGRTGVRVAHGKRFSQVLGWRYDGILDRLRHVLPQRFLKIDSARRNARFSLSAQRDLFRPAEPFRLRRED